MAAPVADKVVLPLDTGNTGKKKRTQTRTVGADSVHTDYVILEDPHTYGIDIGITEEEIISVSTWAAFWTNILKPKLDVIIATRRAMNTRIDAVEAKVGQIVTV